MEPYEFKSSNTWVKILNININEKAVTEGRVRKMEYCLDYALRPTNQKLVSYPAL